MLRFWSASYLGAGACSTSSPPVRAEADNPPLQGGAASSVLGSAGPAALPALPHQLRFQVPQASGGAMWGAAAGLVLLCTLCPKRAGHQTAQRERAWGQWPDHCPLVLIC